MRITKSLVFPALMVAFLAALLAAGPVVDGYAQAFNLPGVIAASACRVGAVLSTDQFTSTGFSNVRTARPNDEIVAGTWVIVDNFVADTSVVISPNCVAGGTMIDGFGLNLMGVRLKPTIVSAQDADIQEIKLVLDQNLNGQWDPLLDTVLQTKPGSELDSEDGAVFFNGAQAPIFTLFDNGVGCPNAGAVVIGAECARGLLAVVVIGDNPKTGAQFGLELTALAGDVPNAPFGTTTTPISSGFSSSRNPQASNVRLHMVGGQASSSTPLEHLSNGSGAPESDVDTLNFTGGEAGEGLLSRFRAPKITPSTREVIAMTAGLCDGSDLANTNASILPKIAGAAPTIAGGLASLPCIPSAMGTTDLLATGINGATLVFRGPLAKYMGTVRMYADDDCDGTLFEMGELVEQVTPRYNQDTGEAIATFGGRQEQVLFTGNGVPVAGGCDLGLVPAPPAPGAANGVDPGTAAAVGPFAPLVLIWTVDIDSNASLASAGVRAAQAEDNTAEVEVAMALQSFDDTAMAITPGGAPCAALPAGTPCGSNFSVRGPATHTFTVEELKGVPTPPPSGVAQYDTNGNGVIDDAEFFAAIDDWIADAINDDLFFQVLDAWVAQTPVGTSSVKGLSLGAVTLSSSANGTTFAVSGQGIASMGVEIFSLSGSKVFAQETSANKLTWTQSTDSGQPVANGVYLYVVTVKGADGQVLRSEVKKLVVLR